MNALSVEFLAPIVAVVCYTLLLLTSFVRRGAPEKQTRWLMLFLVLSIIWEFLIFFGSSIPYPAYLPSKALLISTLVLGVTTAVYSNWEHTKGWLVFWLVLILLVITPDILPLVQPNIALPPLLFTPTLPVLAWFLLNGYLILRTWNDYRHTRFPWHANRLLFWDIALSLIALGEVILFSNLLPAIIAGQAIRLAGVWALTYALASHRLLDVRTRTQRGIAFFIITVLSALPVTTAVVAVDWFAGQQQLSQNSTTLFLAITIGIGIFLYQPINRFFERLIYRLLLDEVIDTKTVVRSYSQAISRTLDMQELSLVIIGTLKDLLETTRGALLLVTRVENGYEINPIPGMGNVSRKKVLIPHNSLFLKALNQQHQPLLQYELDFNPDFTALSPEEKSWFQELTMEAYVPVSASNELDGFIAIGPKRSTLPYQPSELELLQILADQTVVALQNARLYTELEGQNDKIRHLNVDLVSQNERLEIMDRVKSDFITIASHELRTPLTQVKGYSDILSAMNDENALTREQTREIVSHINRATIQLEGLITAMLDASQIDVDGMQLTFVQTKIETILRLAIEPLIQAMRERRITLEMSGIKELPPLNADLKRLVQAFTNIMGNAVKYTPDHGKIVVEASVLPAEDGQEECIEVIVADTGIGIDPKYHTLVFEKFFRIGNPQLHSTGSTKFKGAGPGLGLPIAKGVIEAHAGRIWVESEGEDEKRLPGSRFYIILPIKPPNAQTANAKGTETAVTRPSYLVG